jgi:hypothetical protein
MPTYTTNQKPSVSTASSPPSSSDTYDKTKADFITAVQSAFQGLQGEVSARNQNITSRDDYIYGEKISSSLDIPVGHDFTPVNWLRRTVEIHKNMFMSRGFQVVSTYDSQDIDSASDQQDLKRIETENDKQKQYAESRMALIKSIIADNGGDAFWSTLAESASAVGDAAVKAYWNEDEKKYELCPVESIENLYVLWNKDDFRSYDAVAFAYQISKQKAISDYDVAADVSTSMLGSPLEFASMGSPSAVTSSQPMVTVFEVTGKITGWAAVNGRAKKVKPGEETEFNALIVGNELKRLVTEAKKIPRYYILPNKRQRRRPWGVSDVSEAAININLTYVETLSDWRTVSSKVNFPKFKAYGFSPDTQIPKPESRKIQYLPLTEGQDIVELQGSNTDSIDWSRQLDELKEQFVRETGLSRVLFDDPSVTLNSNQALLTSMKPTSDIAEAKKQLWGPIISQIFQDALETIALNKPELKDLVSEEDNWNLRVMWPSVMQKEDPVYQSMLLNRFNAGTMSLQSYLEAQGESDEEIDRLRDEMTDPITAAILGKSLPLVAQAIVNAATAEIQAWYQSMMPQQPPAGAEDTPGVSANGGVAAVGPTPTAADNVAGPISQPGSGATTATPGGALLQANQNAGG